jgi:hypothetical protein
VSLVADEAVESLVRTLAEPAAAERARISGTHNWFSSMIWLEGKTLHSFGTHGLLWTDASANLDSRSSRSCLQLTV